MRHGDLRVLNARERAGLECRAGIRPGAVTYDEIGRRFGVSASVARLLILGAVRKLQNQPGRNH